MKEKFDRHVRETPKWNVGDEVWLSSRNVPTTRPFPKLENRWLGPFVISQQISNSAYQLRLPHTLKGLHPVFHVSLLRKHSPDLISTRQHNPPQPIRIDNEEEWEVEEILDCRKRGNKKQYLVSWKGFGPQENSWEPLDNLKNCEALVDTFDKRFPNASDKHRRQRP